MTTIESCATQVEKLLNKAVALINQMQEDNLEYVHTSGYEVLEDYENITDLGIELQSLIDKYC